MDLVINHLLLIIVLSSTLRKMHYSQKVTCTLKHNDIKSRERAFHILPLSVGLVDF